MEEQSNQELEELPRGSIGSEEEADSGSHYGHDPLYAGAVIIIGVAMTLLLFTTN